MKIYGIGSGAREHSGIWALCKSPHVTDLWCAPGNIGIGEERLSNGFRAKTIDIQATDLEGHEKALRELKPDLVVVFPDNPLALGAIDRFEAMGIAGFGPKKSAARFESSKAFAQTFMTKHHVACAEGASFTEAAPAIDYANKLDGYVAVKKDELAFGKGVWTFDDPVMAEAQIKKLYAERPGRTIVIQKRLVGVEASVHVACNGTECRLFEACQDYKRTRDGYMSGGMGSYSPNAFVDSAMMDRIEREIIAPWLIGCAAADIDYRGILYLGLMITKQGPKVLEFNSRFGDSELETDVPRLLTDMAELMHACATGSPMPEIIFDKSEAAASVCVVLAGGGYPLSEGTPRPISGLESLCGREGVKAFHAATFMNSDGEIMAHGGKRVLAVTAWGKSLRIAHDRAYEACELVSWDGKQMREDIAEDGIHHLDSRKV